VTTPPAGDADGNGQLDAHIGSVLDAVFKGQE
jgi:hypothetical protein